ncbi:MAG TPA: radical SAM protein [Paludibacter sp.]|nr:radical SAM protein [Paludibacter sp.]
MILFDQIIFGPIQSRRLGLSLGVNLLPIDAKICTFNCIYCECGFNTTLKEFPMPTREQVREILDAKLQQMALSGKFPDVITFAGNGEPTLHPDFEKIIDDTIVLRNKYCPLAKVSVLSNSTRIDKPHVFSALNKVDNNILKFDTAIDATLKLIDQPVGKAVTVAWLIEHFKKFEGKLIIQTMFLRGEYQGEKIDNTTDKEVEAWLNALEEIKPKQVMIYSIDRDTPVKNLQKINVKELNVIASKVKKRGFEVSVAG